MIWDFREEVKNSIGIVNDAFRVAYLIWHTPRKSLTDSCRKVGIVRMRWIVYAALRERGVTFAFIGKQFNRGHDTIIYGIDRHKDCLVYPEYKENFLKFKEEFQKMAYGGDPHPNGTEGRTPLPKATLGRKELTNVGGFSDYNNTAEL